MRSDPIMANRLQMNKPALPQPKPPGYYQDIIENMIPHVKRIMFSGGETLYQKQHYMFIDSIPQHHAKDITLLYVTNGTLTGNDVYSVFDLWCRFKAVNVIVSTDGTGRLFEYFRQGAQWDTVRENMLAFMRAGVCVTAEVTTSIFQMFDLPRICDDLYAIGVDQMSSSLVQWPAELNVRLIPEQTKQRITNDWQTYLDSITDGKKLSMVRAVGDMLVDYMNAENNTERTWDDFKNYAAAMDELFSTDFKMACPDISNTMGYP